MMPNINSGRIKPKVEVPVHCGKRFQGPLRGPEGMFQCTLLTTNSATAAAANTTIIPENAMTTMLSMVS